MSWKKRVREVLRVYHNASRIEELGGTLEHGRYYGPGEIKVKKNELLSRSRQVPRKKRRPKDKPSRDEAAVSKKQLKKTSTTS
jgi:hypothetical protein